MKIVTMCLLSFMLAGCASEGFYEIKRPEVGKKYFVMIEIVDRFDNPNQLGSAKGSNGVCHVKLRQDVSLECLDHEIAHCYDMNWHEGHETSAFCKHKGM